jgi:hypothetical protein
MTNDIQADDPGLCWPERFEAERRKHQQAETLLAAERERHARIVTELHLELKSARELIHRLVLVLKELRGYRLNAIDNHLFHEVDAVIIAAEGIQKV